MSGVFSAWKMFRNNEKWALPDTMPEWMQKRIWEKRRKLFVKGWKRGKSRVHEKAHGETGEAKI